MIKRILLLTTLGIPMLGYSQSNTYGSLGEKSENGLSVSSVLDYKLNAESSDGQLSTGPLAHYTVAATTGLELVDVTLLSVYPNPTADVLVLKTGGLKNASFSVCNAEGAVLFSSSVRRDETSIDFSDYAAGVYYLTLTQKGKVIKTFSIIKK